MSKDKVRITSKVTTFTDVSKSLQDIEKILNGLIDTNTSEAEKELLETEGSTGDIQVTQNADKSYSFEVKTEEGWKTPVIGDSAIKFKDKPASISKQQVKSIDEIEVDDALTGDSQANLTTFDEKANKFILPRPDYDSGWIRITVAGSNITTSPITHTHSLGVLPSMFQIYLAPGQGSGSDGDTVDSSEITWITPADNSTGSGHNYGTVSKLTATQVFLATGDINILLSSDFSATNGYAGGYYTDGSVRILLWK